MVANPGSESARGIAGINAITVAQETIAVVVFINAENRYHGFQKIVASTKCVKPQERMNAAKSQKIGKNGAS